ncbi:MAG TPA: phosphoglycerate dehydrogenase [Alphaproteobacteria bacterium]|nr:phosphoglycerate dehydrogenase [Alphaproteobacteria bacterium]
MATKPRVLISDSLSPRAIEIFQERGIETDLRVGLKPDELKEIIGQYDGLAIRSATKVTADLLAAAKSLKVVGRAGIGVDNVDVPAATASGVVVMNTPFGNSITTAEHAIAMMFALSRQIPEANASTHAGKWEKSRFMGVELYGKVLGLIGAGNIGSIVADRALGLKMRVVAYDPFLSQERAADLGVEKVELDELLRRADFITLHTPLTDQTRNILDAKALAKCKKGVRIVNCARGGLIVEDDLKAALESGHVAGAALDVFLEEPAKSNPLFNMPNVVCTPHLGASTVEAQENVALQVAEQMSDYLLTGAVTNAINMPSVSAEDAPKLRPYMKLAEQLGSLAGQLVESGITSIAVSFEGAVAELNTRPLVALVVKGVLGAALSSVNMVNAPIVARERGIAVSDARCGDCPDFQTLIRLTVGTEGGRFEVAGTLFAGAPRIVAIQSIDLEAELTPTMLYVENLDKPGLIGGLGTTLGDAGLNIATFQLGRNKERSRAVSLVAIDGSIPDAVTARVAALPNVVKVKVLTF